MGNKEANVPVDSKTITFEDVECKVYRDCQLVIVDESSFASASNVQKIEERVKMQERLNGVKWEIIISCKQQMRIVAPR